MSDIICCEMIRSTATFMLGAMSDIICCEMIRSTATFMLGAMSDIIRCENVRARELLHLTSKKLKKIIYIYV